MKKATERKIRDRSAILRFCATDSHMFCDNVIHGVVANRRLDWFYQR
jgi:hypothetical protein